MGVDALVQRGGLARGMVVLTKRQIVLVQLVEIPAVAADRHAGVGLHIAVDGDCPLFACRNRVDGKARAGIDVAAHKHVGLRGLVGQRVGHGTLATAQLYGLAVQQVAPLDALADAEHNVLARQGDGVVLVVGGCKAALGIVETGALFQHHGGDMAVFGDKLLRAVAAGDFGAFLLGLGDFLHRGGHLLPRLQADHCHIVGPAA